MDVKKFKHPCTCMVSGPTMSGKTQFVVNLLKYDMFKPSPQRIIWCYSKDQPLYQTLQDRHPNLELVHGTPTDLMKSLDPKVTNLVILDDQMSKVGSDKELGELFTEGSHHLNLSVIYIVQNLFDKGSQHRKVSLNTQYFVIFKNPRDSGQIRAMASQMYGKNSKFLVEAYSDATSEKYGYLVIDMRQDTDDKYRVRTKIFPSETCVIYAPKNYKSTD